MRIAVIGAGNVGRTLARRWIEVGHEVRLGVRDPGSERARAAIDEVPGARLGAPAEVIGDAEVVVMATPWSATREAVTSLGDLEGRILVDVTNPLRPDLSGLEVFGDDSGGRSIQRWAPTARVVKAFNTVGFPVMADPTFGASRAVMLVSGDDPAARGVVKALADDIGFEGVEYGGIDRAGLLEHLALLWITRAFADGAGPGFAFSLLERRDRS